ncbi:MAG: FAD-dependent oxidoreductase [Syntrophaceae bacterium]|nr:FAD-dependent oxidoreductase [Syntrophaceae bacterium]
MSRDKIVIVGGNACGAKAAARIKRLNPDADVNVFELGAEVSYAGCGMPFYLSGEVRSERELMSTSNGVVRDASYFNSFKAVKVNTNTRVKDIDRDCKVVLVENRYVSGIKEIPYDRLVLATGSMPVMPDIENRNLKNIYLLSTMDDVRMIKAAMRGSGIKSAVIVGAGLIGLEVADALLKRGIRVTVIEMQNTLMPTLFDREMVFNLQKEITKGGVTLMLNSRVSAFLGDDSGCVRGAISSGREISADMVILSVGVRPNTSLAVKAGLDIGRTGAIRVNRHMQTSDPLIYAGGDCVENRNMITGRAVYAPMGSTANKHGRIIADNICGKSSVFEGVLGTAIFRFKDYNMARSGLTETEAKAAGYDYITVISPSRDRAHFHPESKQIIIKLIVDRKTGCLFGSQIVGLGDVAKRADIVVAAMKNRASIEEISSYDLAYAPPFSAAMDSLITAANIARNKLDGTAESAPPEQVWNMMQNSEDYILLDVRSPMEFAAMKWTDPHVVNIPLEQLRNEIGRIPRDKTIITLCQVGIRSYEAQRILSCSGFTNVKFMDGGFSCWAYEAAS